MSDYSDLREKIDEAKWQLPLPALMAKLGLAEHAEKSAHCPFAGHEDKHPSFSVFHSSQGKGWQWKCFAGCGEGDEIAFLWKLKGLSATEAISSYLDIAGFPPVTPKRPKSREWLESPNSHGCPESPESPVSPVSNGQGLDRETEKVLKELAARNACTERNTARKRSWQLQRDLAAVEKGIGRELNFAELTLVGNEWHRFSQPFLDPAKTRDSYLAGLFAGLRKVRVPTGEGDTLNKALKAVSELSAAELPVIPGMREASESWRKLSALHRELSRRATSKQKTYFLSYRDAAKAIPGLSHQEAHEMTLTLERFGVISIVSKGVARPKSGKAADFRYLLAQSENGSEEHDGGFEL